MSQNEASIPDETLQYDADRVAETAAAAERLRRRQRSLVDQYKHEPQLACIDDHASTSAEHSSLQGPLDPVHTWIKVGRAHPVTMPVAVHSAVGGLSDHPVPGDLLCAALASCVDSTIRVVSNALRVELRSLAVSVTGQVDVRGALLVSPEVNVGFQAFRIHVYLRAAPGTDAGRIERMLSTSDHSCVVMQTLRGAAPISVEYDAEALTADAELQDRQ